MLKTFPKTHITLAAAATVIVSAAVLMSPSADVEAKRMSYTVDLEQGLISGVSSQEANTQAAAPAAGEGLLVERRAAPGQKSLDNSPLALLEAEGGGVGARGPR